MKCPGRMLQEVLRSVFRKPVTVLYPHVKIQMPDRFRGKLQFHAERCIGCKLCMKDCPTAAIDITKFAEKQFCADLDMARCIYCGQCVDSCPKKALETTVEFELAQFDRKKLQTGLTASPVVATAKPINANAESNEPSSPPQPGSEPGTPPKPSEG